MKNAKDCGKCFFLQFNGFLLLFELFITISSIFSKNIFNLWIQFIESFQLEQNLIEFFQKPVVCGDSNRSNQLICLLNSRFNTKNYAINQQRSFPSMNPPTEKKIRKIRKYNVNVSFIESIQIWHQKQHPRAY